MEGVRAFHRPSPCGADDVESTASARRLPAKLIYYILHVIAQTPARCVIRRRFSGTEVVLTSASTRSENNSLAEMTEFSCL